MRIILWGTGKIASKAFNYLNHNAEIIGVTDSDSNKWGTIWNYFKIQDPDSMLNKSLSFDKIIVAISNWREVIDFIIKQYGIDRNKIDNIFFLKRIEFLKKYDSLDNVSLEQRDCIDYVRNYGLDVFNYNFAREYDQLDMEVYYDEKIDLYYTYYNDYRMYFSRDYRKKTYIINYMRGILREQDQRSPHYYNINNLNFNEDTVALDAGVAEGNFALDIINKVKKIYLVEADPNWCEALKYTFKPFGEKVVIIQGYLGSGADGSITIDETVGNQKLDVVKMDIEGMEYEALLGARKVMERNALQMRICVYHNVDDCEKISNLLEQRMYTCNTSNGYMVFVVPEKLEKEETPQLARGILCAEKSS